MTKVTMNIMQVNLNILRYHGLWPKYLNGENDQHSNIKLFLVFLSISILWCGAVSHMINIIIVKKKNVDTELLDDIAVSLTTGAIYCIFFVFLIKINNIIQLLQELQSYGDFGKPDDAEMINNSFNLYTKLYYFYCLAGGTCYFIVAQTIESNSCKEKNEKFDRNEVCGFFTHVWLPFDYNFTPAYEILFILQYLACIYAIPILTTFFMIFVALQHLICKIRHLKKLAENIFAIHDEFIQKQRLINCIRYHQYIISLCDAFNECFGQISFLYITIGAAVLSVTAYQSLREVTLGSLLHLGGWLMTIAFICIAGQQLINESESVAYTFYNLQWLNANNSIKIMVKVIIMRSQKPLCLKALSFGVMSLSTFMAIINSAYRYLTLMKQMV